MDLEEEIKKAAIKHSDNNTYQDSFIHGAFSGAAKDYWYNEFQYGDGIIEQSGKVPSCKMSDLPCDIKYLMNGSFDQYEQTRQMIFGTGDGLTDQEKLDIEYGITPLGRQHRQYLKDNPDKPMSFDDWKYMVENYKGESSNIIHKHIGIIGHVDHGPHIFGLYTRNVGKSLMASVEQIPFEIGGLGQEHHKGVIAIVPDQVAMDYASEITRMIAADSSIKNIIVITKEHYEAQGKDSILKSRAIGITEMPPIKSIVPIADVIPEEIISKQEFLKMHDKAVERSITEETYRESRAWDIKKEKKVSHKRNNKRK